MENNTFGDQVLEERGLFGAISPVGPSEGDGEASCFMEGEEVRVVLVGVRQGRIADWKGGVKDWTVVSPEDSGGQGHNSMVNGAS